jgi:hypothetical protein
MKPPAKCKKHRQYKAVLKPRVPCPECWEMYEEKHPKGES